MKENVIMAVFDSVEELIEQGIEFVTKDETYFYVRVKPRAYYENSIWKVNRKTRKVEYMMFTEYIISVSDHVVEASVNDLIPEESPTFCPHPRMVKIARPEHRSNASIGLPSS